MIRTASFLVLSALAVLNQTAPVSAEGDPNKESSKKETPAALLKVGDPAPALKVTKWLQGSAVHKFEPGTIYVVSFWATWCPGCVGDLAHLAELQDQYKHQGVTIVGFTSRDIRGVPNNTEEQVASFVKKRGTTLTFAIAYADDNTTSDDWLKAAGQAGFCTFVVDRAGQIAYMGSPMFLNLVLPKVVAGGASAKTIGDEVAKVLVEYEAVFDALVRDFQAGRDLKPDLDALKRFENKYPPLTDLIPVVQFKLSVLPKYGDPGEANEYAAAIVTKGINAKPLRSGEVKAGSFKVYGSAESFDITAYLHYSNVLVLFREGKVAGIYSGWDIPGGEEGLRRIRDGFIYLLPQKN
jgi:thiol-disulfide isomerase/thioredoxin